MTKATGNPKGRPAHPNGPWETFLVMLRQADLETLRAAYPGADASRRVRELILDMLERV